MPLSCLPHSSSSRPRLSRFDALRKLDTPTYTQSFFAGTTRYSASRIEGVAYAAACPVFSLYGAHSASAPASNGRPTALPRCARPEPDKTAEPGTFI